MSTLEFVRLHSRHSETCKEHLWNLEGARDAKEDAWMWNNTCRGALVRKYMLKDGGTGESPRGGANVLLHFPSFLMCQACSASCDNLKGWWSVASSISSFYCQASHLASFRGIVSRWVSFVTIDFLHANTCAGFFVFLFVALAHFHSW